MQIQLHPDLQDSAVARQGAALLGQCVHCGFCNATCPTYRLLGDELDGPRGRIYLVKGVLEGRPVSTVTQQHLDRCLTCRNCETTCPSGVQYAALLDVGRELVDARVPRPALTRMGRFLTRSLLTRRVPFAWLVRVGRALRPLLPRSLRASLLPASPAGAWPRRHHARKVLLLQGCVQPGLAPGINAATARVLDALGLEVCVPAAAGCCGAIRQHLGDPRGALDDLRRNIDAWWPQVEAGAVAVVANASGCSVMLHEYAQRLRDDPAYAAKAVRISELACDVGELVQREMPAMLRERVRGRVASAAAGERVAFHPPCTLQHGLRQRALVESLLRSLGVDLLPFADSHLCCGSAGTYSLWQPRIAATLREQKLAAIHGAAPRVVLSANIGCIAHLAAEAHVPVKHWVEWLDEQLAGMNDSMQVRS